MRRLTFIFLIMLALSCSTERKNDPMQLYNTAKREWARLTNNSPCDTAYVTDSVVYLYGIHNGKRYWLGYAVIDKVEKNDNDTIHVFTDKDIFTQASKDCDKVLSRFTGLDDPNFKKHGLRNVIIDRYYGLYWEK